MPTGPSTASCPGRTPAPGCTPSCSASAPTRSGGRSAARETVELMGEGPASPPPQDALASGREDLERALRALPEAFREAVVLRDVQELSYAEIAAALGDPSRHRDVAHPPGPRPAPGGAGREDELSCDPERVTGFVDGELDAEAAAAVAAHLETCAACRAQAEAERGLRARLRSLPAPELPAGLEARVRAQARRRPGVAGRGALGAAARGVPRRGSSGCAATSRSWPGTSPATTTSASRAARCRRRCGAASRGSWPTGSSGRARACPGCPTASATWRSSARATARCGACRSRPTSTTRRPTSHVSVFVVPHGVRLDGRFAGEARGRAVRLLRVEGETVGIVAGSDADARALRGRATARPRRVGGGVDRAC